MFLWGELFLRDSLMIAMQELQARVFLKDVFQKIFPKENAKHDLKGLQVGPQRKHKNIPIKNLMMS